jgi:hypothetical protein
VHEIGRVFCALCVETWRLYYWPSIMNMYWVYDLPNWLFGVLTIAVTVAIGLGGLYATRKWVRRVHGDRHSHN